MPYFFNPNGPDEEDLLVKPVAPIKPVGARKKSSQQDLDALDISNTEQEDPLNLAARQNQLDARKRKLVDFMRQQGAGPSGGTMIGGQWIAPSAGQAVVNAAAGYEAREMDQQQLQQEVTQRAALRDSLGKLSGVEGRAEIPPNLVMQSPEDQAGVPGIEAVAPASGAERRKVIADLMDNPAAGSIGGDMLKDELISAPRARAQEEFRSELEGKREKARQILADTQATAAEKREAARFAAQMDQLEKRIAGQKDLKQIPSMHISIQGGGNSSPAGTPDAPPMFAGPATQVGVDPRSDGTPVYRVTKTGKLYTFGPNGEYVEHKGAVGPKPPATGNASESERSSAGYLGRMQASEATIGKIKGGEPNEATSMLGAIPGVGQYARRQVESDPQSLYRQAADDWIRAKLRKESGAAIPDKEMAEEYRTYFPQPGDSKAVVAQKAQSRKQAEEQLKLSAGRAKPVIAPTIANGSARVSVANEAQWKALPSGTKFVMPDGREGTK